jgi:hypothetical protein
VISIAVAVVLGGIGAAAGFTHTHNWAADHGQTGWLAWADAVVIEGIVTVAGFEIHREHRSRSRRGVSFPVVVLVVGFVVQMAAQVAEAEPSPTGWLVAAMPALGFLTVVKLLMRRLPTDQPAPAPAPTHAAAAGPSVAIPAPAQPTRASSPDDGTPRPERPATSTLARLPEPIRRSVTDTASAVHAEGREVTAEDIRRAVALPAAMLTTVVDELNTTVNHRPVTT